MLTFHVVYQGLLGPTGVHRGLLVFGEPGSTGSTRGLPGSTGVYQGLLGPTGVYRDLLGPTGVYRGLLVLGRTRVYRVYWGLPGSTGVSGVYRGGVEVTLQSVSLV